MTEPNPESILDSVKKVLGLSPDYTVFDLDVLMYINATFGALQQLGVGSDTGFFISDNSTEWSQYVADIKYLGLVKSYISMAVRLAFDPPATSFTIDAMRKMIDETGWRINVSVEELHPPTSPDGYIYKYANRNSIPATVHLDYASIVTIDASAGAVFDLTLTADATINAPVNGVDGQHITLELVSNGFNVTWGSGWNFGTLGIPTLSGGGQADIISALYQESVPEWRAGYTPGF